MLTFGRSKQHNNKEGELMRFKSKERPQSPHNNSQRYKLPTIERVMAPGMPIHNSTSPHNLKATSYKQFNNLKQRALQNEESQSGVRSSRSKLVFIQEDTNFNNVPSFP